MDTEVVRSMFGLDLGKKHDPTALVMADYHEFDLPWTGEPWNRIRMYKVRGAKRWPLGTPYCDIVEEVAGIIERPAFTCRQLVIDGSGVGEPVVELFSKRQYKEDVKRVPVVITGGDGQTYDKTTGEWKVSKRLMISMAQILFEQHRIMISPTMKDGEQLIKELVNYRYKAMKKADEIYDVREFETDDLVLALVIMLWFGEKAQRRFRIKV